MQINNKKDYQNTKKNILLIKPPTHEIVPILPKKIEHMIGGFYSFASQPAGLLRIGSYLKSLGNKVKLIDCSAEVEKNVKNSVYKRTFVRMKKCGNYKSEKKVEPCYNFGMTYKDLKKELLKEKQNNNLFDEIWVTSTMTYHWEPIHKTVEICKEVFPQTKVILGGLYTTLCPEHARKSKADIIYEGEFECANNFPVNLDLLDYIPEYTILKSTRGCPNNCSYCAVPKLEGRKMRFRNYLEVVNEIEDKIEQYNIKKFVFWESNLLINSKNHFEKILDLIIEKKLDIELDTPEGLQPNLITQELANKMKQAGFQRVYVPLESVNDKECKERFKRVSTLKDFENCVDIFKKAGFEKCKINVFILIGLPNQKLSTILQSIIKVWELECNPRIMPFTLIPTTEEHNRYHQIIKNKELDELHPFLFCFASDDLTCEELKTICYFNKVHNPFDFIKKNNIKNRVFKEIINLIKKSKTMWDIYYKKNINNLAWINNYNADTSIINFEKTIKPHSKILDIGCGTGKNSLYLQNKNHDVYGIDISQYAIKKIIIKKDKHKFKTEDFLKSNYNENSFDYLIDIGCFHMLNESNFDDYVNKTKNILKKEGFLLLRCFSKYGYESSRFFKNKEFYKMSPFLNFNTNEKILKLFSKDFEIISFKKLFWCSIKNEKNEYVMKPGMYEFIFKKK
tara:strand:- start:2916 stop:4955 length:2040 start_codon:yes stop_codon:yes gene_type:complete